MNIEDIFNLEGIKILDENIFHRSTNLLTHLYDCRYIYQISLDKIIQEINNIENGSIYLSINNVFSIEEVKQETEKFTSIVNDSIKFHSQHKKVT